MKKRIAIITMILIIALISVGPVFASYYYSFTFSPPFAGSMKWDSDEDVSGLSPYVDPNGSSAKTNYFLTTAPGETVLATHIVYEVDTTARRYFTYQTGYGGVGQDYCLAGFPSNFDFNYYYIPGVWLP